MRYMRFFAIITHCFFVWLFFASPISHINLFGQEAELLDVLVRRGTLTQQEASEVKKASAQIMCPMVAPESKYFRIWGYTQFRYTYSQQRFERLIYPDFTQNGFTVRRIVLVYDAQITDETRFLLVWNNPDSRNLLNSCLLFHKVESLNGFFKMGFCAPQFSLEEMESASRLYTPERSIAVRYWGGGDWGYDGNINYMKANQCLSGSHIGIQWYGKFDGWDNYTYNIGITNSQNSRLDQINCSGLAYWVGLGYAINEDNEILKIGLNTGYADKSMGVLAAGKRPPSGLDKYVSTAALNPYLWWNYENFTLQTEAYFSYMQNAKTKSDYTPIYTVDSPSACPFGGYLLMAYRFDIEKIGGIEPTARFSYILSDGRGIDLNDLLFGIHSAGGLYDNAFSYYFGVNWYMHGKSIKTVLGYEYVDFTGSPMGKSSKNSYANIVTLQLQIIF